MHRSRSIILINNKPLALCYIHNTDPCDLLAGKLHETHPIQIRNVNIDKITPSGQHSELVQFSFDKIASSM